LGLQLPAPAPHTEHVFHLYVARSAQRDALLAHLRKRGIGAQIHYPAPVHLQPAYRDLGFGPGSLPHTERAAQEVLSLPLYPEMPPESVKIVAGEIARFTGQRNL
ncbi:MAG: erythromycin biosynthesis sensory transduction protein eryC1, partial [Chloroflexi bacterium]